MEKMRNLRVVGVLVLYLLFISFGSVATVHAVDNGPNYLVITFMNQDPDPAQPGEYVELRWRVDKVGNKEMNNVTFILEPSYPFSFDPGESNVKTIEKWVGPSDYKDGYYILYYKVRVAPDALQYNYEIKLKYTQDGGRSWVTNKYYVRVNNDRVHFVIGSLTTSPTKLVADTDEAELDMEIQNVGEKDAQNVNVEVSFPKGIEPTYEYSDRASLGTIPAGQSKVAKLFVDIDKGLKEGIYEANVTVHYKPANTKNAVYKTQHLVLQIPIKSKPTFEIVSVETDPKVIYKGDEVEMKVLVKNVGGKKAESTSLRVLKESSQPFSFDDKVDYIGTLEPGDEGEAVLKFKVDKDAVPKDYLFDVEIRCISDDNVITEDKTVKLEVAEGRRASFLPYVVGAVVVLFLILIFYVYGRRGNKGKKK